MKKSTNQPQNKPALVAILIDRSGSMSAAREETVSGFNGYIDELKKKDDGSIRLAVIQFDSISTDMIYNGVPLSEVKHMTLDDFVPRANTPLYDAVGSTIENTALEAQDRKVLFVTFTDGMESPVGISQKFNLASVQALIKSKEEPQDGTSPWTFVYVGVGLNGWSGAAALSHGTIGATNILRSSHENTARSYSRLADATAIYCANVATSAVSASNLWDSTEAMAQAKDDPTLTLKRKNKE